MRLKSPLTRLMFINPAKVLDASPQTVSLSKTYKENLEIKTMTFEEAEWIRNEWASKGEGWPFTVGGLLPNYNQDNQGFFRLELGKDPIGSISMITFNGLKMAYIGFYILRSPHRGKGYGRILMEEVIGHTTKNRGVTTFGLNCVEAAVPMYEKYGFKTYTKDDLWSLKLSSDSEMQVSFNEKKLDDAESFPKILLQYDQKVYGDSRPNYLRGVCSKPSTTTVISENEGQVTGYGVLSERIPAKPEENKSFRIGPVYADSQEAATEIIQGLIASVPEKPSTIYLETPGTNPSVSQMMINLGFTKTFTMNKMYRGEPPKQDEEKIFCYSSLAFG